MKNENLNKRHSMSVEINEDTIRVSAGGWCCQSAATRSGLNWIRRQALALPVGQRNDVLMQLRVVEAMFFPRVTWRDNRVFFVGISACVLAAVLSFILLG